MAEYRLAPDNCVVRQSDKVCFSIAATEYQLWLAGGGVPDPAPEAPPLLKAVVNCGLVRFAVLTTVLTTTDDTIGVGGVTRVSAGWYRIFNAEPDNDLLILPAPIIRDAADIRVRVSKKTATYTDIKTVNAAGVATDASEVTVMFSKVV